MKRVVLYSNDFEPITVIELIQPAWDMLNRVGFVRLPIISPPSTLAQTGPSVPDNSPLRIVNIIAEKLYRNGCESLMLFTADEESALMLRAAFLPGQQGILQQLEWNAFAYGFIAAMRRLGSYD